MRGESILDTDSEENIKKQKQEFGFALDSVINKMDIFPLWEISHGLHKWKDLGLLKWKGDFCSMPACCWWGLIQNAAWPRLALGFSVTRVTTCVCTAGKAVWTDRPGDLTPSSRACAALCVCGSVYHSTSLDYSNGTPQKHIVHTPKEFAVRTNILNLLYKQMCYSADSVSSAADSWERGWQQHREYYLHL